jgi:FkbM family methyltransferase
MSLPGIFINCLRTRNTLITTIPDSASFLSSYKEIFLERIYAFKFEEPSPKILDLGANIGLSVLFFKSLYPKARITAFEADSKIFEYLEKNIHGNGFSDVKLINKAAWYENTPLKFTSEGADGGRVAYDGDDNVVELNAIDIAEYLKDKKFDFLKMDIEGAEELVLPACKRYLPEIKYLFVEYHSKAGKKQSLNEIINIMAESGFRVHIHSIIYSPSPFVEIKTNAGFDLQLNIFAWRE